MSQTTAYQALGTGECLALLAGANVGRLALHAGALPTVAVVDATLTTEGVVVRALPEPWFAAATDGAVVAFEADDAGPGAAGRWSVVVVGEAAELTALDPGERARLDAALHAASAAGQDRLVRISLGMVSGRRRVEVPAAAGPTGLAPAA